jgi:hypothetical protein
VRTLRDGGRAANRRRCWRALARLAQVTALVLIAAGRAHAADDPPSMSEAARAAYDAGMAHFAARAFVAAAQDFRAAYAIDPRREIRFAEAQATRLAGDCPQALALYQAFLDSGPPPQQIEATRLAMSRCREVPAAGPPGVAAAAGIPTKSPQPSSTVALTTHAPAAPASATPIWRDKLGLSLGGAALASWAVAIGFGVAAGRADADARAAPRYDLAEERRHVAEDRARWAQGAALLAGAFTAGAAGRWLWIGLHRSTPVLGAEGRF